MAELNDEMRVTADYAISTAKERYGLDLDFSEDSLAVLDNILEKIYWGFSGHSKEEGEGGLIYNSAIIWGSYLGEYMRLKWGGTWLLKGTERRISITSIEFSPISFIFQRITTHPEYSVKNFIQEAKNVIYASVIHPQKAPAVVQSVSQTSKPLPVKPVKAPLKLNKRVVYITGGILGLLIIVTASMAGYAMISGKGFPAIGSHPDASNTPTMSPRPTLIASATLGDIPANSPTVTQLPTYTPIPTQTPLPSRTPRSSSTPAPSETPTSTFTPTATATEYIPPTRTPTRIPTEKPPENTFTPIPSATKRPTKTPTNVPSPTEVPAAIESCGVSPNSVPAGEQTSLTFNVKFTVPGYGITGMNFSPGGLPGQGGCTDSNSDGNATASCSGNSGRLPPGTSVSVDIQTPLGDCSVSYSSQ